MISSTVFRGPERLVALEFGLDFFSMRSSGIFCFLHDFCGDFVGDDRSLAVDVGRLGQEGVLWGGFNIDDAFLNVFFCVGARIRCDLICTRFVQGISPGLQPPILLLEVEGLFLSLSVSDDLIVICDFFCEVCSPLLVCSSWCSSVPLVGLLLVDWVVPVRRPATEPGEWKDCPERSTDKWHTSSGPLMGL